MNTTKPEDFEQNSATALLLLMNAAARSIEDGTEVDRKTWQFYESVNTIRGIEKRRRMEERAPDDLASVELMLEAVNSDLAACVLQPYIEVSTASGEPSLEVDFFLHASRKNILISGAWLCIVRMIQRRTLDLLRMCDCGTWYIADISRQKACTKLCYRRQYQGSDDFKRKRREYYRDVLVKGKAVVKPKRRKDAKAAK